MKGVFFAGFVVFLSLATVTRGLTSCGTYSCPRPSDPAGRTRCCSWFGSRSCCLPGGSTCSDSGRALRNYCPSPTDGKNDRLCCIINNQPKCCELLISVGTLLGIIFGGVALLVVILLVCCCWSTCPLGKLRARRRNGQMAVVHYPRAGIVQTTLPPYPGAGMQTTTHPYPAAGIQTASQPYPAGAGVQTTIQPYSGAGPQAISPPYPVTGQTQNAGPPYPGTGVQVQDWNQVYGKN
ncbi:hypothetical protein ABFA07_002381 [Porites harrisoni]